MLLCCNCWLRMNAHPGGNSMFIVENGFRGFISTSFQCIHARTLPQQHVIKPFGGRLIVPYVPSYNGPTACVVVERSFMFSSSISITVSLTVGALEFWSYTLEWRLIKWQMRCVVVPGHAIKGKKERDGIPITLVQLSPSKARWFRPWDWRQVSTVKSTSCQFAHFVTLSFELWSGILKIKNWKNFWKRQ